MTKEELKDIARSYFNMHPEEEINSFVDLIEGNLFSKPNGTNLVLTTGMFAQHMAKAIDELAF